MAIIFFCVHSSATFWRGLTPSVIVHVPSERVFIDFFPKIFFFYDQFSYCLNLPTRYSCLLYFKNIHGIIFLFLFFFFFFALLHSRLGCNMSFTL